MQVYLLLSSYFLSLQPLCLILKDFWMKLFIALNLEPNHPGLFHLLWKPMPNTFAYLILTHSHRFLTYVPKLLRTVILVHLTYYPLPLEIKSLICR